VGVKPAPEADPDPAGWSNEDCHVAVMEPERQRPPRVGSAAPVRAPNGASSWFRAVVSGVLVVALDVTIAAARRAGRMDPLIVMRCS
jgi:hypothetical protein